MQLPRNEVGISDILQWRDCPRRMVFGMRRHHERGEMPESWSPQNAYGSAIHMAIHAIERGSTQDQAVQTAFEEFAQWLDPEDLDLLRRDLATYEDRDILGVETVAAEDDMRFPLFVHPVHGQMYFRFKLDRLYRRLDDPTVFIHKDYKSSKWAKSEREVDEDLQFWAYNVGIYEIYPECTSLIQMYDQLLHGEITAAPKSDAQREQMREWLIRAVTAILNDEEMLPEFNQWCPWCPLKFDCPVVQHDLTDFARSRIGVLMPREPKKKADGSDSKVLAPWIPDPEAFDTYVELLPDVSTARKTLEDFETKVRDSMKQMPSSNLQRLGYERKGRTKSKASPEALRTIFRQVGEAAFFQMVDLSKAAVERFYAKDREQVDAITEHFSPSGGYDVIEPRKPEDGS